MSHYDLGEQLYMQQEYLKAYDSFQKSLELDEELNNALNYMGCCLIGLGNYTEAIAQFDELISLTDSEWERPYFNKGRALLRSGKIPEAAECFNQALLINPHNEDVHYYLGVYYEQTKNLLASKNSYEQSLQINFEQPETHLNLGNVYFQLHQYEDSIRECDLAFHFDSQLVDALHNKYKVLMHMRNFEKAHEVMEQAYVLTPHDVTIIYRIAVLYSACNELETAEHWLQKGLALDPTHEDLLRVKLKIQNKRDKMAQNQNNKE